MSAKILRVILDQIRDMAPETADLCDQAELLASPYMRPCEVLASAQLFTPMEHRMVNLLFSKIGRVVNRGAIMDGMFFDRAEPQPKVIDIYAYRVRPKLARMGYAMTTIPHVGYCVSAAGIGAASF